MGGWKRNYSAMGFKASLKYMINDDDGFLVIYVLCIIKIHLHLTELSKKFGKVFSKLFTRANRYSDNYMN